MSANDLPEMPEMKNVPLRCIILKISGCRVIPVSDKDPKDSDLMKHLTEAARAAGRKMLDTPIVSKRMNEVGNKVEPYVKEAIDGNRHLRLMNMGGSGYPDILFEDSHGRPSYLECKTLSEKSIDSPFRAFYLSPSKKFKIALDARHILLSYVMREIETGQYVPAEFRIIDIANLRCQLKYEWNCSNRELYGEELRPFAQGRFSLKKRG